MESVGAVRDLVGLQWKESILSGKLGKEQQLDEVAKEFEGILVRQYLDEALKPMDGEGGIFGFEASPMYEQLIKDTLASGITEASSLGFSSVLQAQLYQEITNPNEKNQSDE